METIELKHAKKESELTTYQGAVDRNLLKILRAAMNYRIISKIEKFNEERGIYGSNFFVWAYYALFNDMIAHLINVLERNPKSASYWYIISNCPERDRHVLKKIKAEDEKKIKAVSEKLSPIRNKTHFHIDREAVLNPALIWKRAPITGREINAVINLLYNILYELCSDTFKENKYRYVFEKYQANDVVAILDYAEEKGITVQSALNDGTR